MINLTATGKHGKIACEASLCLNEDKSFNLEYSGTKYIRNGSIDLDSYTEEKTLEYKEFFKGTWKEDDANIYLQVLKAEKMKISKNNEENIKQENLNYRWLVEELA